MIQTSMGSRPDDRPVRPALIVDASTMTGLAHSLRRLLLGLRSEACQPALVHPPQFEVISLPGPPTETMPYPAYRIPFMGGYNRRLLTEQLAAFKPTVLHCFDVSRAELTRHLATALGVPYVLTFSRPPGWIKPLVVPSHCAALIAWRTATVERLKRRYPFMAESVFHVNVGAFVSDKCACFGEPDRIASMVTVQPLHRLADLEPVLNALRHLTVDGHQCMLAVIGKGRADRALFRRINELGLNEIVTLVPQVRPLRNVLAGADIFLQTQPVSPTDANLLDALSVGTAVAVCRRGAEGVLTEDENAVFFQSNDELSIYTALRKLLVDRGFARRLAEAGQQYIRRHHSVSRMVEDLIEIYHMAQHWYAKTTASATDASSATSAPV